MEVMPGSIVGHCLMGFGVIAPSTQAKKYADMSWKDHKVCSSIRRHRKWRAEYRELGNNILHELAFEENSLSSLLFSHFWWMFHYIYAERVRDVKGILSTSSKVTFAN